jgi:molecular chaperone GrpE
MSHKTQKDESAKKIADALKEPRGEEQESIEGEKRISHLSYEEMEQKLNETEAALNEYKEGEVRLRAEMQNEQRRAEKRLSDAHKYGIDKFAGELLPVVDSIERGLSIEVGGNEFAMRIHEGMEMTLSLLLKTLEKFGVKQINPISQPFNPELHQAISMQSDPTVKPNTVVQVLQKGYLLNERLVRPALVVVSKGD